MKKYLLPETGNFYKANLHIHTTVSDGAMTPEEVKREYAARGYSIVAYTDHEVLVPHNELSDDDFLAITSYEISTNARISPKDFGFEQTYHMNLYALDKNRTSSAVYDTSWIWRKHSFDYVTEEGSKIKWERKYSVESLNALIAKANEDGFLVSYNHPNWSLQTHADYAGLKGLWGVEWYNTGCAREGYPDTIQPIDDFYRDGEYVFPLATDDAHAGADTLRDCFGGFVMVKAESLDYDTVMQALARGDFYSSTGPTINELYLEDGVLHVKTSPLATLEVITERRKRWRITNVDNGEYAIDMSGYFAESDEVASTGWTAWFRLALTDEHGNKAYTRAYTNKDKE